MSTTGTRWPLTNIPLRLPLSIAIQRPCSKRRITCAREIRGWAMRRSARRSRPITTSLPAAKVRDDPSYRTVSAGGEGRVIGCNSIGTAAGCEAGSLARQDVGSMAHRAVSVICRNAAIWSPRVVMMLGRSPISAEYHYTLIVYLTDSRADRRACRRRMRCGPYAGDHVDRAAVLAADTVWHTRAHSADEIVCEQSE